MTTDRTPTVEHHGATSRVEWPTVLVTGLIYLSFALLTWFHHQFSLWVIVPLAAFIVAWHGSLQHEVVHGHPTPWLSLNRALVFPSLWLWLPYLLYERSHRAHHDVEVLADPLNDPESFYISAEKWRQQSPVIRRLLIWRNTLLGRLLLGPIESAIALIKSEYAVLRSGDTSHLSAWVLHLAGCAITVVWVVLICEIDIWVYVLVYAYPGLAATLLRSFLEHQAHVDADHRIAIVEANPLLALMFLNNNLHRVHHDQPAVAWYRLPVMYWDNRDYWVECAGNYVFSGYWPLALRYFVRAKEPVVYPVVNI